MTAASAGAGRWRATGLPHAWVVRLCQRFGYVLFHLVFRLRVEGLEHVPVSGPVLLAGNHSGFLDGPLVFIVSPRPAAFLTKSELFVGPLGRFLGWNGQIPVHRGRPDRTALKRGLAVLAAGGVLGVFPEGTRGSGQFEQVQDGIAYLALRGKAPIVPVACRGTAAALPKGRLLPRWLAPIQVIFGEPFTIDADADSRSRRAVAEAAEQIRARLVAHLDAARSMGHLG